MEKKTIGRNKRFFKRYILVYFAYKPILDSLKLGFDPLEL